MLITEIKKRPLSGILNWYQHLSEADSLTTSTHKVFSLEAHEREDLD